MPPTGFVKPYIDTRRVREVRMNGGTAMLDAYEQRKRIEWFEENPYTRELNGAIDLDFNECGCQDGSDRWVDRNERKEIWYVEVRNEAHANTICDVTFKPAAVDICQGHGAWRTNGDGCACDEGYSGQYLGPVENVNTRKRNNIEDVNGAPHPANTRGDGGDGTTMTDKDHILNGIQKKLDNRGNNIPIEPAPGEVGGTLGTQDTHNLGCTTTEAVDDVFIKKRMEKSNKRASVSLARSPSGDASGRHPNVGTIYAYNRNRSKFFERKKHVDQQETTSDALYKDDCSGVMTANTLKQMTDTMIIACTGRTRAELVQGLEDSTPALNKIANEKIKKRDAWAVEEKHLDGWGNLKDPRDIIGRKAYMKYQKVLNQRAEDSKNRGPLPGSPKDERIKEEEQVEQKNIKEQEWVGDKKDPRQGSDESVKIIHDADDENHEKQAENENMFKDDDQKVKG